MSNTARFTLVFSTCDEYADLWEPFFHFWGKYWPSFNAPVISTGTIRPIPNSTTISTQHASSWSSRVINALSLVKTDFILFCLDDFWLSKPVDTEFFDEALSIMENDPNVKCIVLHDELSEREVGMEGIEYSSAFCVRKDCDYKATTQLSLWRKDYLRTLLRRGENAWRFEMAGTKRAILYAGVFLYRKDCKASSFSYPEGGVVGQGSIRNNPETIALLSEYYADTGRTISMDVHLISNKKRKRFWAAQIVRVPYLAAFKLLSSHLIWLPYWP